MYAVIRRYRLAEGAVPAEVLALVQRGFVPIVERVPGFVAFHGMDTGDGGVVSVSVFASQEGAAESTRRAAAHIGRELAPFFAGPPTVEEGEVGAHAVGVRTGDPPRATR